MVVLEGFLPDAAVPYRHSNKSHAHHTPDDDTGNGASAQSSPTSTPVIAGLLSFLGAVDEVQNFDEDLSGRITAADLDRYLAALRVGDLTT